MTIKTLRSFFAGRMGDKEAGSGTFIFNFLLFPIVLASFGLAFDFTASFWAKGSLQQYLDAATQSALGQIDNPTNGIAPNLGTNATVAANNVARLAEKQYAQNRFGLPFLACQNGGRGLPRVPGGYIAVTEADGCTYSMNTRPNLNINARTKIYTLTMNVHEATHYVFLQILGSDFRFQTYNLRSTATLDSAYTQR